jgi:acyl carrier protein
VSAPNDAVLSAAVISAAALLSKTSPAQITRATDLFALGLDSFALAVLAAQVQTDLGLEFPAERLLRLFNADSIGDIIDILAGTS